MLGYSGITGPGDLLGSVGSSCVCRGRACWMLAGIGQRAQRCGSSRSERSGMNRASSGTGNRGETLRGTKTGVTL